MDKPNVIFNVENGNVPPRVEIEIIERTGEALKVNNLVDHEFTGVINSVSNYLDDKKPDIKDSIVSFSMSNGSIQLRTDINRSVCSTISGKLEINPELNEFQINKDVFFSSKELLSIVRKRAYMFGIKEAKRLIDQLRNFEVKFEQTIEKGDDGRGNKKDLVNQSIKINKGSVDQSWKINAPLFIGESEQVIELEIEIEKGANNQPEFAFYSLAFDELVRKEKERIILSEIEIIKELGYHILRKD